MTQTARNTLPLAMAGGGIGGLAAALALAQRGFRVLVLEQARAFGEAGVGLQVAPNALAVLDALGVGDVAKRDALLIERLLMMDAVTGETVSDMPCGEEFRARFGNPYAVAHRADVHGALLEACRAHDLVSLRTDCRVTDFSLNDNGVSVLLHSGERIAAAALVGADGITSQVRKRILDDGDPLASGAIIFRALIPADAMPKDLQRPYPTFWAGQGTHVIYYPVRDWKVFNLGCTVVTGQTEANETDDVDPAEVLPLFAANCDTPLRVMRIPKAFRRYVIRHRHPAENWTTGVATLLGDAAHPMVQYIAQGAAMALEDAICLAVEADACDGDFAAAFQRYQDIRIVRSARVQISSLMLDRIIHAKGVERRVRNSIFAGRTDEDFYDRMAWLYTSPDYVK